jgi:outer membrane protein assembly factor BamB
MNGNCVKWMAFLAVNLSQVAGAGDWPQWRGPQRDGTLSADAAPVSWPEQLKLRWKVTVGDGHSSPILAGGRIYSFTRQQGKEFALSIDPANGRVIWRQFYTAPYTMNPAAEGHGEGPKSTPVLADGRLYTLGIIGILTCWDATTGAVKWRKDFSKIYKTTSPLYGTAMSPVVDRGLVIAHVGGQDDGALTAFDGETGEVRWRWTGDGPAYASPVIVTLNGIRQVVTETQANVAGLSVANGQLLWKIPFTTEYVQNIPSPLVYHDELIFSGYGKPLMAIRAGENGGQWHTESVWRNTDVSLYMSSPVAAGDLLFGFSQLKKGQFFCVDARTGATQWTSPPRQGDNAAVLISGENLILLKDDGELLIARATGKSFELLRHYQVAESPTWAHPLVLPHGVVIKDATTLALWTVD